MTASAMTKAAAVALLLLLATGAVRAQPQGSVPLAAAVRAEAWLLPERWYPSCVCYIGGDEAWVTCETSRGELHVVAIRSRGPDARCSEIDVPAGAMTYDAAHGCVYVTHPEVASLQIVDISTRRVRERIALPHPAMGVCLAGRLAYASAAGEPEVYVVDLEAREVVAKLPLSQTGYALVVVGGKLYVATGYDTNGGSIQTATRVEIVDLSSRRLLGSVDVPGSELKALAWDGGHYVYAAANVRGKLVRIDATLDALDPSFEVPLAWRPGHMVIDPVRQVAVLGCTGIREMLCIVSLDATRQVTSMHGGQGGAGLQPGEDGRIERLWVPNVGGCEVLVLDADDLFRGMPCGESDDAVPTPVQDAPTPAAEAEK